MLKGEDHLTQRQYCTLLLITTVTATFTATTTSIATTCKAKSIVIKILELDELDVQLTKRQYVNVTTPSSTSTIQYYYY